MKEAPMRPPVRPLALALLLPLAGCFAPTPAGGVLGCNPDPHGKACPDGYHCASDSTCWPEGQDPSGDGPVHLGDGGPDAPVSGGGDLALLPDLACVISPTTCAGHCGMVPNNCGSQT